jgi:hypothetical protein
MYNYREHESSYTGKPQGLSRTRILAERAGMEGSLGKGRVGREQVHESFRLALVKFPSGDLSAIWLLLSLCPQCCSLVSVLAWDFLL